MNVSQCGPHRIDIQGYGPFLKVRVYSFRHTETCRLSAQGCFREDVLPQENKAVLEQLFWSPAQMFDCNFSVMRVLFPIDG